MVSRALFPVGLFVLLAAVLMSGRALAYCPPGPTFASCMSQERQREQPIERQPHIERQQPIELQPRQQPVQIAPVQIAPVQIAPVQRPRPTQAPAVSGRGQQPRQQSVQIAPAQRSRPTQGPAVPGSPVAQRSRPGVVPVRVPQSGSYAFHGRSFARFQVPRYGWPRGMHYTRHAIGERLPKSLLIARYIISNWIDYQLTQPPDGSEWIRYGSDILLVNSDSGEIEDAAYSAFAESGDADPSMADETSSAAVTVSNVRGAGPKAIGAFEDWIAATHQEAGQPVCYAFTRAQNSIPAVPGRGAVILTVTQRNSGRDAVAIEAGFAFAPNATVKVQADQVGLDFYTDKRAAFARNGHDAVTAFRAAARAVARSPGPHEATVTDTFSLKGFTAAYEAISKACPPQ
jgi:Ni/Co efflux regulator RcnB